MREQPWMSFFYRKQTTEGVLHMKIAIIGYSGSGKSTLAKYLATAYNLPLLHLDTVQFTNNWQERDRDEARAIVRSMMQQENWVIDGNYSGFYQKQRLEQATQIIFLDFSRWQSLYRVYLRFRKYRNKTRSDMADGCIEKMDLAFVWWVLYKGRTHSKKQHYEQIITDYADKVLVIRNQQELDTFYHQVSQQKSGEDGI